MYAMYCLLVTPAVKCLILKDAIIYVSQTKLNLNQVDKRGDTLCAKVDTTVLSVVLVLMVSWKRKIHYLLSKIYTINVCDKVLGFQSWEAVVIKIRTLSIILKRLVLWFFEETVFHTVLQTHVILRRCRFLPVA